MDTPSSPPNGDYKLKVGERIATLEAHYNEICKEIAEIKDNHLTHLQNKVDQLQWLIVTTLVTAVIGLALRIFDHI